MSKGMSDSNTTFVKVKCNISSTGWRKWKRIQIQHLLKLNRCAGKSNFIRRNSNTTFVKVKWDYKAGINKKRLRFKYNIC